MFIHSLKGVYPQPLPLFIHSIHSPYYYWFYTDLCINNQRHVDNFGQRKKTKKLLKIEKSFNILRVIN